MNQAEQLFEEAKNEADPEKWAATMDQLLDELANRGSEWPRYYVLICPKGKMTFHPIEKKSIKLIGCTCGARYISAEGRQSMDDPPECECGYRYMPTSRLSKEQP